MGAIVEMAQEILVAGEKSDQEWINEGIDIRKGADTLATNTTRTVGNWYGGVQESRRKDRSRNIGSPIFSAAQICKKAGYAPSTPANCANFVRVFPTEGHMQGFTLDVCMDMLPAHRKLGDEEVHGRFMSDMKSGEAYLSDPDPDFVYNHPDSATPKQIKRQVALVTGKKLDVKSDKVEDVTDTTLALSNLAPVVETHCKTKKSQRAVISAVQKEVKRIEKDVRGHFIDEVNAAATTMAEQRTAELRESAQLMLEANKEAKLKADDKFKMAEAREKRLPMFMTKKEFKLIQGCLHSDRIPKELRVRFDKAFIIFNRLAEGGAWDE